MTWAPSDGRQELLARLTPLLRRYVVWLGDNGCYRVKDTMGIDPLTGTPFSSTDYKDGEIAQINADMKNVEAILKSII